MSMSGVAVAEDVVNTFQDIKLKHSYRFVIIKLSDNLKEIVCEYKAGPDATYEEFQSKLPADDCRYAIYDYEFEADGGKRQKILFFAWSPETAKIKSKMLYAASKDAAKKSLNGIHLEVQCTDPADIDESEVLSKVKSNFR